MYLTKEEREELDQTKKSPQMQNELTNFYLKQANTQIDAAKLDRKQCCRELALATTRDIHGLYKETFTHNVDNLLVDADKIYNWLMADL